ncbi:MAG: SAM-dependent methyltransferase [Rhodospirillaceae bacterium]|nr:SAM-dependent methyltransferase [Rhodospirillaceae bacterium]
MTPLDRLIRRLITQDGPMPVSLYMTLALQHPKYGYYRQAAPIGLAGDFVTAPEVSQVFGELIGLWMATVWAGAQRPGNSIMCEAGPGRGVLLSDALRAIRQALPDFEASTTLHLVESSETLRAQQAEALSPLAPTWHDSVEDLPEGPLFLIANEFLDALPVTQFIYTADGWRERMIGLDAENQLLFIPGTAPATSAAANGLGLPNEAAVGDIHEVQPGVLSFVREIATRIAQHHGAALLIDYGENSPFGHSTLRGIRSHRIINPLTNAGDSDLTVDVDFRAVRQVARSAGAIVQGPVGMGPFLHALGVETRRTALTKVADAKHAAVVDQAIDRLLDPDRMGKIFKVLAIAAPSSGSLPGFSS